MYKYQILKNVDLICNVNKSNRNTLEVIILCLQRFERITERRLKYCHRVLFSQFLTAGWHMYYICLPTRMGKTVIR